MTTISYRTRKKARQEQAMRDAIALLAEPGQVVELRVLLGGKYRQTDAGYFDDFDRLAAAAYQYCYRANIYITLNPVNPALLARYCNRVEERAKHTTTDADIVRRRWLPIDFDPIRPPGVSSTNAEHDAALALAELVEDDLARQGWPTPILADSGNGAHLLYPIEMPNNEDSTALIKRTLEALSAKYSTPEVAIDTSVHNAARIWKLYGSLSKKGDSTPERPHRYATILQPPAAAEDAA